jgi:hypothetical protein
MEKDKEDTSGVHDTLAINVPNEHLLINKEPILKDMSSVSQVFYGQFFSDGSSRE